ncbi:MAG: hypothetical protein PQ612_05940 [Rickettsiales bacterium]|nr:hypothetical protein [Pseudomonadota bacterium]MDA0966864.1 hypothetical protein [Pseudomonadota bacterium]MDG4543539.1 hypothetical protein [Rickettsiales bacterium]MDG4545687.1 hypothetical protein [Rickettsiales bacterium]MDG4547540.1 hypothetical protein [Rickettsiales bacterium]
MSKKKQGANVTRVKVKDLIPEHRLKKNDIKFNRNKSKAKMRDENVFDWCYNKKIIDGPQWEAGQDFYFVWYNGVVKLYGSSVTAGYESTSGGAGDNITEFRLNCSEAYRNLGSLLEPEGRTLLVAVCEGKKPIEHIPAPKYYANERLRRALDVIAIHKGYKSKPKI